MTRNETVVWVALAVTGLLTSGCAGKQASTDEALRKYAEGDVKTAARLFAKACDGGDGAACVRVGDLHAEGRGVAKSDADAARYYERACDADDPSGCFAFGRACMRGEGVQADEGRGTAAFDRGCRLGHGGACTEYAVSLWRGRGIAKAPARARALLEKNCGRDQATACFNLGVLLRMGDDGVPKDAAAAKKALSNACQLEHAEACAYLEKHGGALDREAGG